MVERLDALFKDVTPIDLNFSLTVKFKTISKLLHYGKMHDLHKQHDVHLIKSIIIFNK